MNWSGHLTTRCKRSRIVLETVKVKRVTNAIVEQIRSGIAMGKLKAGDRLPSEREMVRQLGVSRPSLREALLALAHTGFIEILHGSGAYIRNIGEKALMDPLCTLLRDSNERYLEMMKFRIVIETWAVGQAATCIGEAEKTQLGLIIDQMRHRLDKQAAMHDLDTKFHLSIARASQNSIYFQVANTIFYLFAEVTRMSHDQLFVSEKDQAGLFRDHHAIYEAIIRNDATAARRLMKNHLKKTLRWTERCGIKNSGMNPAVPPGNAGANGSDTSETVC
jgi:GntR family transcriptional regulator, transcriptional repressor for pyruvate dehydrogenase complex